MYLLSDTKLSFLRRIPTESPAWDFGFEPETGDLVALTSGGSYLSRFEVSLDGSAEVGVKGSTASKEELEKFFEGRF